MSIKFIILGSGSSMGVPRADGYSGVCDLNNKKNYRSRCSALLKFDNENFLIDSSPDLRQQLLHNKIKSISKVFYTHQHADQTHGINDLRPFFLINKKKRISIESISVEHGKIDSLCYIINKKLAYASDISLFYKKDIKKLMNLDYLIVDCLWYKNHSAHFNLNQVLDLVEILKPKKTVLTNMHTDLDYDVLKKNLPKNIVPGYDGMKINL